MMGRSHMASGALVGAGVVYAAGVDDPLTAVGVVAVTTLCALLPDLDHPDATIARWLWWPGQFIAWCIRAMFGHRGITHSILGLGLLTIGLAFLPIVRDAPMWVPASILLGCATHIAGDMLTVSGCPLLWPMGRRFRIGWMTTGSWFETSLLCPLFIAGAVVLSGFTVGVL